jgi:hypothetical protein
MKRLESVSQDGKSPIMTNAALLAKEDALWICYDICCEGRQQQLKDDALSHAKSMKKLLPQARSVELYLDMLEALAKSYQEWKRSRRPLPLTGPKSSPASQYESSYKAAPRSDPQDHAEDKKSNSSTRKGIHEPVQPQGIPTKDFVGHAETLASIAKDHTLLLRRNNTSRSIQLETYPPLPQENTGPDVKISLHCEAADVASAMHQIVDRQSGPSTTGTACSSPRPADQYKGE